MRLVFSQGARKQIQEYVDKITQNDMYFYRMVEKAKLKFPIIEDAFRYMGLPEDIKYICIQESGLRGDAVSPSFAVGYWQFKDFTAKEVGLTITYLIDERKHLYRSSVGAAKYFYRQYQKYRNWVYAVTAYYTGTTGAAPFVKPEYVGATTMYVTEEVHWYALKAIAHKIAYQNYIESLPTPAKWLVPLSTNNEQNLQALAQKHNITVAELKYYNPWIVGNKLPALPLSYFIMSNQYACCSDPHQCTFSKPLPIKSKPYSPTLPQKFIMPVPPTLQDTLPILVDTSPYDSLYIAQKKHAIDSMLKKLIVDEKFTRLSIQTDPLYGKQFIVIGKENLNLISNRYQIPKHKLIVWNTLTSETLYTNQILYLVPLKKRKIHILQNNQSLQEVADLYGISLEKLLFLNDLVPGEINLSENQKIYLRAQKPSIEGKLVYKLPYEDHEYWQTYEVKEGETLYTLAKLFGVKADELKKINYLPNYQIKPGQVLKIKPNEQIQ